MYFSRVLSAVSQVLAQKQLVPLGSPDTNTGTSSELSLSPIYSCEANASPSLQVYTIRDGRDRPGREGNPHGVVAAQEQLQRLHEKLANARSPHLCPYQMFAIRSSLAYMVRPYAFSTLHERS